MLRAGLVPFGLFIVGVAAASGDAGLLSLAYLQTHHLPADTLPSGVLQILLNSSGDGLEWKGPDLDGSPSKVDLLPSSTSSLTWAFQHSGKVLIRQV